jgi:diaminopimelate decarboxylase
VHIVDTRISRSAAASARHGRLDAIAEEYGTPVYVYDGEQFEAQFRLLRASLPADFELFYSVKANPLMGVLQVLRQLGCGVETVSEGELLLALNSGFQPQNIIYTCPGKTPAGIALAIRNGAYCLNVESVHEAERINRVAKAEGGRVRIAVRINPAVGAPHAALQMSGVSSQFGIDEEALDEFFEAVYGRCTALDLIGVHVYSGTQILSAGDLLADAARTFELAIRVTKTYGVRLQMIDIGGGFGIPYQDRDEPLDLDVLTDGYREIWREYQPLCEGVRVIVESGRFLVADAGELLTRVLSTKVSRGTKYVMCDAGYSHHPSSFHIGRFHENRFPVAALERSNTPELVTVVGPTGTPVDILAKDVWLDHVEPGDLLRVAKSGAYGYTNSCQLFLSGPRPAEVMLYRGKVHLLRKSDEVQQIIRNQERIESV